MRAFACAILAAAPLGGLTACGDDDKPGTVTVIERTVTETAPKSRPVLSRCGDVVFEENSGNAAFDVVADGITCDDAEALLRSDSGLEDWNCEAIPSSSSEAGDRLRCANDGRRIEYRGGN